MGMAKNEREETYPTALELALAQIDKHKERIQQLTDELQWLQDNHVRVCSRESKLDLRIQQLTKALETIATRQGHWTPDQTIAKKALENDK